MVSRPPMHAVIYEDIAAQIASGAFPPDYRLASEAEMAEHYGVSRMTVRHALGQLEAAHLLIRRRGVGTFVAEPSSTYRRVSKLGPFENEIGTGDLNIRTQMRALDVAIPPDDVAHHLRLRPRQRAIRLLRFRIVGEERAAIQDSWIPYALAPALARGRLVGGSLYRTLGERCGIQLTWAEQQVSAAAATPEQAEWLGVAEASPLLTITRFTYAGDPAPVEFARSWTRPEFPLLIRLES